MTDVLPGAAAPGTARTRQWVIDADVHPMLRAGYRSIEGYLPAGWRRRFDNKRMQIVDAAPSPVPRFRQPQGVTNREDARPPGGGPAGSDPEWMVEDYLDRYGIDVALLNNLEGGALSSTWAGPDESIVLCRAVNDYFVEQWLPVDRRYRWCMLVPSQDPVAAAREIERLGDGAGVSAVALPLLNVKLGNRYWFPVYEAAVERGLPILLHVNGTELTNQGGPVVTGWPESFIERYMDFVAVAQANLSSILLSGVLERYPGLKFMFVEFGFSWVLPLVWRIDKAWSEMRIEVPWVKRPPSEYVAERLLFTTQPIDEPRHAPDLYELVRMLGTSSLAFSTDYPHWDGDLPENVLTGLPPEDRQRLFWDNAARFARL